MKDRRGFTLIEVIVVAAIIAILAGILVPMIFNQIDEAKNTRALAECKVISNAVVMFRKDTAKWPVYYPGDCSQTYLTLQTGSGTDPVNAAGDWQLSLNSVALGIILNLPGLSPPPAQTCYNDRAKSYLIEDKSDPWGHNYIVNAFNFATEKPVWVISAGPNGKLDTSADSQTLNDLAADGDDLGIRIK